MTAHTLYTVTFRAAAGNAGIRALRGMLKVALRRFSLRAIEVRARPPPPALAAEDSKPVQNRRPR